MNERVPFMHSRDTRARFASVLQHYIDRDRLSVEQLADATGVSVSTVYRWLRTQQLPDAHELRLIAAAKSIDLDIRLAIRAVDVSDTSLRIESAEIPALGGLAGAVRDSLIGACHATQLAKNITEAASDKIITPSESAEIMARCAEVQASLDAVRINVERSTAMRPGPRAATA
jgi:transcriptional regulator with XRE-family HTH domain